MSSEIRATHFVFCGSVEPFSFYTNTCYASHDRQRFQACGGARHARRRNAQRRGRRSDIKTIPLLARALLARQRGPLAQRPGERFQVILSVLQRQPSDVTPPSAQFRAGRQYPKYPSSPFLTPTLNPQPSTLIKDP